MILLRHSVFFDFKEVTCRVSYKTFNTCHENPCRNLLEIRSFISVGKLTPVFARFHMNSVQRSTLIMDCSNKPIAWMECGCQQLSTSSDMAQNSTKLQNRRGWWTLQPILRLAPGPFLGNRSIRLVLLWNAAVNKLYFWWGREHLLRYSKNTPWMAIN